MTQLTARFKDVKIGGIFTNAEVTTFYRKISKRECRALMMCNDGKMRANRKLGSSWYMLDNDRVYFSNVQEYTKHLKYQQKRSGKMQAQQDMFQQLGTLARTKVNLRTVGTVHGNVLNMQQLKKLEDARMIIGWLDKQVRHQMQQLKNVK